MAISRRTATSGTFASGASAAITLPTGTTDGDIIVVVIGNAGTTGPTAPTGWTTQYNASAGAGQNCAVFTASYSAALPLTFTNAASIAAWACNSFFETSRFMSLDGAAVAAINTTSNTTLPTGAPSTGPVAGDFEVLLYTWTSNATISTVASGSTIDATQANSTTVSVAIGINNTTSLGASTATTAFSQTLSATNARKTGVGLLLKSTVPATRQVGGEGIQVDYAPVFNTQRQTGFFALQVDLVPSTSNTYTRTVTASQATAAGLAGSVSMGRTLSQPQALVLRKQLQIVRAVTQAQSATLSTIRVLPRTLTATQAQSVSLRQTVGLVRRVGQGQLAIITGVAMRLFAVTQATSVRLRRQVSLTRAVTQAQTVSSTTGRGYLRTISAVEATAVRLVKSVRLVRQLNGSNRPGTVVRLAGLQLGRVLRVTSTTQVRLLKQVRLARSITKATAVGFGALPVQLRVVSVVQTRSLALGRNVFLTRGIAQGTLAYLAGAFSLARTVQVPTVLARKQDLSLTRVLAQPQSVTLGWRNVTPRYPILVTASVSQHVSLSSAGAGKTAKQFVVDTRRVEFVVGHRSSGFAVARRGVRFTVEER